MIRDYFWLAYNSLRHRKKRSWLTIIGTLIGILAVVALISIGQGLESSISSEFEELGGNKVFVMPGGGISSQFSSTTFELTDDDVQTVRSTRGISESVGMVQGNLLAEYDGETQYVGINGLPVGGTRGELAKEFNGIEMVSGRYLLAGDSSSVVVSEDMAEDSFEEEIRLRSKLEINGTEFRVVGIFTSSSTEGPRNEVKMPIDSARDLLDKDESYDAIVSEVRPGLDPGEVADDVRTNLRQDRDVEKGSEDFQVQTAEDVVRSFQNQLSIVRAVLVGIGAISLFVGGVGIMNTMYTSVTERTREIGIMKAIGATRKQILALFLIESGVIGMIGGILGATLGIGLSYAATFLITDQLGVEISPYVSPELVLGAILFSFTVGMISGALPAIKAARKEPVEALRYK